MRILERCLSERGDRYRGSYSQFYTAVYPHTMGLFSSRKRVIFISANGFGLGEVAEPEAK